MLAKILRLRRNGVLIGLALPSDGAADADWTEGSLEMGRGRHLAIHAEDDPRRVLAELYAPAIVAVDRHWLLFRGYERTTINALAAGVLQEWIVCPAANGKWTRASGG